MECPLPERETRGLSVWDQMASLGSLGLDFSESETSARWILNKLPEKCLRGIRVKAFEDRTLMLDWPLVCCCILNLDGSAYLQEDQQDSEKTYKSGNLGDLVARLRLITEEAKPKHA